ncbi:hypothetical protein [Haloterrigena alkaliphila]|nr:hypothetical protein [Haloterrigena alkaliphila]QSX00457.2 hypothetical protein J0X25_05680 [Haloterrigena alkaliphila]
MNNGPATNGSTEPTDVNKIIDEHRELFERLADSDLPIAPYFENALNHLEESENGD